MFQLVIISTKKLLLYHKWGLPSRYGGKESACQCRRHKRCAFNFWVGKILWRRKWQPVSVFWSRKSHGQRSLAGCNPRSRKDLDTTEQLTTHTPCKILPTSSHRYRDTWPSWSHWISLLNCQRFLVVLTLLPVFRSGLILKKCIFGELNAWVNIWERKGNNQVETWIFVIIKP